MSRVLMGKVFVPAKDDAADGLATMFNGEGEQGEQGDDCLPDPC
jgi:hypothetical protein